MRFYLDQYARHLDQGKDYLRLEDAAEARYHLLMAAKYLLQVARRSEPARRPVRYERALRLRDLALGLDVRKDARKTAAPKDAKAGKPVSEDEDESLTPASQWLLSEKPDVGFDQIAGLQDVKEAINWRVIYPIRHPEAAGRFRKRAGGGILLYGPPGTGKTMLANKDLGPALVIYLVFLGLFLIVTRRVVLGLAGLGALVGTFALTYQFRWPQTVSTRIEMWLQPWDNHRPGGVQLAESLWARCTRRARR